MRTFSSKTNINSLIELIKGKLKGVNIFKMAKDAGFQSRKPQKITPVNFLKSFFLMALSGGRNSYECWAEKIGLLTGKTVSKQAVAKKMTNEHVEFLKEVLECTIRIKSGLAKTHKLTGELLRKFKNIWLHDSTLIKLNGKLSKDYPGNGNQHTKTPKAMVKIDMFFNLIKGYFEDFRLASYRVNDLSLADEVFHIAQKGDLVIRDMGYLILELFREMTEKGIYFISRLKTDIIVMDPDTLERINLVKFLENKTFVDKRVLLGAKKKVPVRFVAIRLDEKAIEQRKRKLNTRRYTHSAEYMKLLEYSFFITNADEQMLTIKEIVELYGLRWRIEIIFKSWKSYLGMRNVIELNNKIRVDSYLYCMLIFIVLFVTEFNRFIEKFCDKVSLLKLTKFIAENWFFIALELNTESKIRSFFEQIEYHCRYETRHDRLCFWDHFASYG